MTGSDKRVIDARGEEGLLVETPAQGKSGLALIRVRSGEQVQVASHLLRTDGGDGYRLDAAFADLRNAHPSRTADLGGAVEEEVVPIAEEVVQVGKRVRETGRVRIQKHVSERTELVDEPLLREEVEVERVPVNRVLTHAPEVRHEGDTMIIPVVEERYVVQKQLILKEELRVTRRSSEHRAPQEVTLRTETVEVERLPAGSDIERTGR